MLAIDVEFLTGRFVATAYNDRDASEWPPHPTRLYSALVATWSEDEGSPEEAEALAWIETRPPPRVYASPASVRPAQTVFVPVNDIQTVSEPEGARAKVREAEAAVEAARGDAKALAKAEKALEKAGVKLASDTAKAIEVPTKFAKDPVEAARGITPEGRMRQGRTFPSVTPEVPRVRFEWADAVPPSIEEALRSLCLRLIRLGHSSSFVRASLGHAAVDPALEPFVPDEANGTHVLRVPAVGQRARLEEAFAHHGGVEPRILPTAFASYREGLAAAPPPMAKSVFGADWIVFEREKGPRLPMVRGADVAHAIRGALLKHADTPVAAVLSGHEADGRSVEWPHLALVPLPYVASGYATGELFGVALVLPRATENVDPKPVYRAVARWEASLRQGDEETPNLDLWMGRAGAWSVRRVAFGETERSSLKVSTWTSASRTWVTATPIALDRNPGDLHAKDATRRDAAYAEAERIVARACTHVGLPMPTRVDVSFPAGLSGVEDARKFPPYPRARGKTRRVLVHAHLEFDEVVEGPVLLGAGRYFGLGLCRPLKGTQRG